MIVSWLQDDGHDDDHDQDDDDDEDDDTAWQGERMSDLSKERSAVWPNDDADRDEYRSRQRRMSKQTETNVEAEADRDECRGRQRRQGRSCPCPEENVI